MQKNTDKNWPSVGDVHAQYRIQAVIDDDASPHTATILAYKSSKNCKKYVVWKYNSKTDIFYKGNYFCSKNYEGYEEMKTQAVKTFMKRAYYHM